MQDVTIYILASLAVVYLVMAGAAVLVVWRLISERRYYDNPASLAIGVACWVLMIAGICGGGFALMGLWSIPWSVILLVVLVETVRARRATRQYTLLWALTVSAERGMPLVGAIEAFAEECGGRYGARARRLAAMLAEGVSLPDALARSPRLLPPHVLPLVRVGCESGALAPALRKAATIHNQHDAAYLSVMAKLGYCWLMTTFGMLILVFVGFKILPQFARIFCDFGAPLPAMTQRLFDCVNYCGAFWLLRALLLLLFLLLYTAARYVGLIQWDLPGLGRLTRRNDTATILDGLAVAAAQGRPLSEAIRWLAEWYPKWAVGDRLRAAAAEVESGGDWCEGLFHHGLLPRADRAVLQAAQRVGNLPWTLREMADSNRRRLVYHAQALAQMLFPPVVLAFGLIVMFIVVGMFMPLIALIGKFS